MTQKERPNDNYICEALKQAVVGRRWDLSPKDSQSKEMKKHTDRWV